MFAGSGLQLAFQQALQMRQALGLAEQGFEWLGFAQQDCGSPGRKRAKCHMRKPEVAEAIW
ncbi:hypothetical protein D3C84_908310 [compost metagenome]